jgi:hypothetical glycosyl hydrolase
VLYNLGQDKDKNWIVAEESFQYKFLGKCESIMCQGNGYMGIRATTEENYLNNVRNTFVAGTFNKFGDEVTELPNASDVIEMQIQIDGEELDLSKGKVENYLRKLNLRNGLLERSFIWTANNGAQISFDFKRMVSLKNKHLIVQKVTITPLNKDVKLQFVSGINGRVSNSGSQHFIEGEKRYYDKKYLQYVSHTTESGIDFVVNTTHQFELNSGAFTPEELIRIDRRKINVKYDAAIKKDEALTITKTSNINTSRDLENDKLSLDELKSSTINMLKLDSNLSFEQHLEQSEKVWEEKIWSHKDIQIDSANEFDQLALRFAIYHLTVMTPAHDNRMNIGAKGLSGEGYKGHAFWDTEIFMLPHFILADPTAARSLIEYRYNCIDGARRKALENGYEGAMYPWESAWISDGEVTPLYGAADIVSGEATKIWTGIIEQHITSDVAYGAYYYYVATGDQEFMDNYGYEIILDTAKFWQSRLEYNQTLDRYEINEVIGPDEYKEHINNNAFTNYMAHWNIKLAMQYSDMLKQDKPEIYKRINEQINIDETYIKWNEKVDKIFLPQINENQIVPQDDTYLSLKEIDLAKYKASDVVGTIYDDYNMDQINKLQVSKQADVLVLFYLMENLFSADVKKANFYYYEPKCLHDSSLSLSTHSILASDLQESKLAYELYQRACRIDLGPVMTTSDAGIHSASFGGMWQCVVNGFVGVRVVNEKLRIQPNLPESWNQAVTKLHWQGQELRLTVTKSSLNVVNLSGNQEVCFTINDTEHQFKDEITVEYRG